MPDMPGGRSHGNDAVGVNTCPFCDPVSDNAPPAVPLVVEYLLPIRKFSVDFPISL